MSRSASSKNKYRITIEIETQDDFNPHQIEWRKLFKLSPKEKVKAYVEDFNSLV